MLQCAVMYGVPAFLGSPRKLVRIQRDSCDLSYKEEVYNTLSRKE